MSSTQATETVPSMDIAVPASGPLEPVSAPPSEPAPAPSTTLATPFARSDAEVAPSLLPEPAASTGSEPMQVDIVSDDARQDLIEQIFQRVEEEMARRAQEEEERSRPGTASKPPSIPPAPATPAPVSRDPSSTSTTVIRDRRRGSISVSRFGQVTDLSSVGTHENPSKLPSRKNSLILNASSTGAFYQAQKYAGSADSFASASELEQLQHHPGGQHHHPSSHGEEEQVTQMETIVGKVSLGKAVGRTIARRLSRARTRSRDILAIPPGSGAAGGMVIGVSVEEATVETTEHHDEDGGVEGGLLPGTPTTFVFAQAEALNGNGGSSGTRSRRSTVSMPNGHGNPPGTPTSAQMGEKDKDKDKDRRLSGTTSSWMAKAKDLTKKLKRRSMAVLPQNAQNSSP